MDVIEKISLKLSPVDQYLLSQLASTEYKPKATTITEALQHFVTSSPRGDQISDIFTYLSDVRLLVHDSSPEYTTISVSDVVLTKARNLMCTTGLKKPSVAYTVRTALAFYAQHTDSDSKAEAETQTGIEESFIVGKIASNITQLACKGKLAALRNISDYIETLLDTPQPNHATMYEIVNIPEEDTNDE